jgi:elongation factor Tu
MEMYFMVKMEKDITNKVHCNIGTIGHVDHGKTTLTAALTLACQGLTGSKYLEYDNIDNTVEERRRKITIRAAHVEYETKSRHYSHIDCPGHQDYIKNMIVGAFQMEGVILVVSAVDGVQVQTREHVILSKEIGIPYIVIYLNKLDRLGSGSSDITDLVEFEIRDLLASYEFDDSCPASRGSAKLALEEKASKYTNMGLGSIIELSDNLDSYIKDPVRPINEPFLMSIEGSLKVQGRGTVITGKILKGIINIDDNLVMLGKKTFETVCLGLEIYRKAVKKAQAGDNVGVLVRGIGQNEVKKTYVLAAKGVYNVYSGFKGKCYILSFDEGGRKKPISTGFSPQFFFRTSSITGKILSISGDSDTVFPGDSAELSISLMEPTVIEKGMRFVIREGKITIGRGVVLEAHN